MSGPGGPSGTTSVVVTPPVIRLNVRPSAHGLVTIVQLLGPATLGAWVPFEITVYKVTGDTVKAPTLALGDEFNGSPTDNFALLWLDTGVYSWADQKKNWLQMPDLRIGDTFSLRGKVAIRDPGFTTVSYCLSAKVGVIPVDPTIDANGEPLPAWRELAKPACGRISFR